MEFRSSHAGGNDSSETRKLKFWFRGTGSEMKAAVVSRVKCDTISAIQLPRVPLSLSSSLFSAPSSTSKTQRCSRPSLLQFKRDETSSDCKLSDYSVAGLNVYDCSLLIACLANSRTKWCRDERNFNLRILFLLSPSPMEYFMSTIHYSYFSE